MVFPLVPLSMLSWDLLFEPLRLVGTLADGTRIRRNSLTKVKAALFSGSTPQVGTLDLAVEPLGRCGCGDRGYQEAPRGEGMKGWEGVAPRLQSPLGRPAQRTTPRYRFIWTRITVRKMKKNLSLDGAIFGIWSTQGNRASHKNLGSWIFF